MKQSSSNREENDELDNERSNLMRENKNENNGGGGFPLRDIPMCGFLSVQYYQPLFDVDTVDVYNRILQSTFYCRRENNFLQYIGDKPDAYGPFWVSFC
jgi:hypothetical protein